MPNIGLLHFVLTRTPTIGLITIDIDIHDTGALSGFPVLHISHQSDMAAYDVSHFPIKTRPLPITIIIDYRLPT